MISGLDWYTLGQIFFVGLGIPFAFVMFMFFLIMLYVKLQRGKSD